MTVVPVWQLHRDDFHPDRNTVRGWLNGVGGSPGFPPLILPTVENLLKRIPAGFTYRCRLDFYHTGGYPAYEIEWPWDEDGDGAPDRDRLMIHAANAVRNEGGELSLRGCPAPGLERVDDFWETFYSHEPDRVAALPPAARNLPGVASSKQALADFMKRNEGVAEFDLKVTEVVPP